jgi:phage terminase Nu1 subunit (DNA packaging protein)
LRSLPERAFQIYISDVRRISPEAAQDIVRQVEQAGWNTEDKQIVATFFGVAVETIEHWQTKGMPYIPGGKGGRNAYDLAAIAQWLVKQRQGLDENREKADSEAKFRDEKTRIAECTAAWRAP